MLKASIYLITFVFLINIVNAITFNEVNYNPIGNDNNKEYAELFSQESINLSNYTIEDLSSSDTLTLLKSSNSNYYLIVEEGFDYSLIDANIYSAGPAIGNNLNNFDFKEIKEKYQYDERIIRGEIGRAGVIAEREEKRVKSGKVFKYVDQNGVNIYNDKLGSASDIYYLFVLNRPFELIKSASLLERLRPVGPDILEPQTDQLFAQVADCCFYFWQFRHNDFI